jgi:hypothetical protein
LARRLVAIGVAIPLSRLLAYIYLKHPEAVPHAEKEKVYLWRRLYGISPSVKQILGEIDNVAEALEN